MSRPEHVKPPDVFYDDTEAQKYATSSRMQEIQTKLSERALELLNFPQDSPKMILDIGCGTGLSSITLEKCGHVVVGTDISASMLNVGREKGEKVGDSLVHDMGTGLSFRAGIFDGAISISALQWICNADNSMQNPIKRINRFFNSLYGSLVRGGRAVFQFYPENSQQVELLTSAALRAGFTGGLLVDYPNSAKAKKYFLVLFAGVAPGQFNQMPTALGEDDPAGGVDFESERQRTKKREKGRQRTSVKSKDWILNKKERRRKLGLDTPQDSKYTGRKRKPKF
eukprot:TRINITY_DN2960_c0_g1_i1.p1 TRINITY_DN2960_c0_g1~~TRINITY_DN2960_c0_g1_i1.p1  ORF type:complete len:283 (+),score=48.50 TRINITY_DN2960_c0_g1_i1:29-877(+)